MSTDEFIQSIINAHGGASRYSALNTITIKFHFTGATLSLKSRPQVLVPTATVSTKELKVVFRGLGGTPDEQWIFTPTHVSKVSISSGTTLSSRENPRAAFKNHKLDTPWDDLDFLYFCGYATWQYFNFPYFLTRPDFRSREIEQHEEHGQQWRVLEVTFPDPDVVASHSRIQKYYFDERFMLRRMDYAPEIIASSPVAHYCFDEITIGGLTFPTFRRVVARAPVEGGELVPSVYGPMETLIRLVFLGIELKDEGRESEGDKVWALTEAPVV